LEGGLNDLRMGVSTFGV